MSENGTVQLFMRKRDLVTALSSMLGKDGGLTDKSARSVRKAMMICDRQMENRKYSVDEVQRLFETQMKRTECRIAMDAVGKCFEAKPE